MEFRPQEDCEGIKSTNWTSGYADAKPRDCSAPWVQAAKGGNQGNRGNDPIPKGEIGFHTQGSNGNRNGNLFWPESRMAGENTD
jgi:hypothetical protein